MNFIHKAIPIIQTISDYAFAPIEHFVQFFLYFLRYEGVNVDRDLNYVIILAFCIVSLLWFILNYISMTFKSQRSRLKDLKFNFELWQITSDVADSPSEIAEKYQEIEIILVKQFLKMFSTAFIHLSAVYAICFIYYQRQPFLLLIGLLTISINQYYQYRMHPKCVSQTLFKTGNSSWEGMRYAYNIGMALNFISLSLVVSIYIILDLTIKNNPLLIMGFIFTNLIYHTMTQKLSNENVEIFNANSFQLRLIRSLITQSNSIIIAIILLQYARFTQTNNSQYIPLVGLSLLFFCTLLGYLYLPWLKCVDLNAKAFIVVNFLTSLICLIILPKVCGQEMVEFQFIQLSFRPGIICGTCGLIICITNIMANYINTQISQIKQFYLRSFQLYIIHIGLLTAYFLDKTEGMVYYMIGYIGMIYVKKFNLFQGLNTPLESTFDIRSYQEFSMYIEDKD